MAKKKQKKAQPDPVVNWVFTLNNPEELLDFSVMDNIRYAIYSEEIGESGTYHFQGYIQLLIKKRISFLANLIPGAHLEEQRAKNNDDARNYCAKITDPTYIDGPYEFGSYQGQGARSDLLECKALIESGKTLNEVAQTHFTDVMKYRKNLQWYKDQQDFKKPRTTFKGLTVVVGPTDCGKSHWANEEYPNAYWLTRPQGKNSNPFFDLYDNHTELVIDEFYGWMSYDFLLRICDKYKLQLPIKGSFAVCQVTTVVITSNKHVWQWYKFPDIASLERRISKVIVFTGVRQCTIFPTYAQYKAKYMTAKSSNYNVNINDLRL